MLLTYGSRGDHVTALQKKLNESGYGLAEDGIYGAKTQAAVRDYQTKNGLSADGIAGDLTWGKLSAAQTAQPAQAADSAQADAAPYLYDASKDEEYQAALAALAQAKTETPEAVSPVYDEALQKIYEKIMGRPDFAYSLGDDALYRQYRSEYQVLGRQAMEDAAGQAAALTGGYGSTYAETAGQQQYGAYLQKLQEIVPSLYESAYRRYAAEGDTLETQYRLAADRRDDAYLSYQQELAQYQKEVSQAQDAASAAYERGYENERSAQKLAQAAADTAYDRQQDAWSRLSGLISESGYAPAADELAAAGMSAAQAAALRQSYAAAAAKAAGGSSSRRASSGRSSSGGGKKKTAEDGGEALTAAQKAEVQIGLQTTFSGRFAVLNRYYREGGLTKAEYDDLFTRLVGDASEAKNRSRGRAATV